MNKKILALGITMVLTSVGVYAATNFNYVKDAQSPLYNHEYYNLPTTQSIKPNQPLKGSVITVPAGQDFFAVVTSPISSAYITAGENVTLALGSDFYYNGNLIAPAGSTVSGTAIEVSKAKHGSMNGKLLLRFNKIITPYGVQVPISAVVKTEDNTGVLVGGTKIDVAMNYTKDVAVGAGAGALAGVVISPLADGSIGRGTALSTAVGAGGGLIKSIWDKGNDVEIPANSAVQLILTQPVTVNPAILDNND